MRDGRTGRPRLPRPHRPAVVACARTFVITTGLVTAYYLLPLRERSTTATSWLLLGGLVAVVLVFVWEAYAILSSPHPRLKAVEALGATLVLFLVLFAGSYYVLDGTSPGSFSERLTKTDALYFTLTTFATVGYGDITARSQVGRVMTMLQMTGGLLLAGVAVRVLTSAVAVRLRRQQTEDDGSEGDQEDGQSEADRQ
ncbi:potassium channel family protein [Streptomyces sp. NPDC086787]|uniref:potassium channel family protein n=1 Tax=Streptomyces sp. NPDC086787 TaxID=3365759 RepID=UPI0038077197